MGRTLLFSLSPAPHNWCPSLLWRLKPSGVSSACRIRLDGMYLNHLRWMAPLPLSQLLGGMELEGEGSG